MLVLVSVTDERPAPRAHHLGFKYAIVRRALRNARELIDICTRPGALAALWDSVGVELVEGERLTGLGLSARNVGDAQRPCIMITLPPPERPNEAYFLCVFPSTARLDNEGSLFVPDATGPLELRVFGMERSMLPDGGLIGFVVEWTHAFRHNYDAPDNRSTAAFWKAILEVVGGTRASVHSASLTRTITH